MIRFINFINVFWINFKRNFFKEIALGIGVIVATITLIIGTTIGDGLEKLHRETLLREVPLDQLHISGNVDASVTGPNKINLGIVEIQPQKKVYNISKELIQKIKSWDEVRDIITISRANFPVTLYVSGNSYQSNRNFSFFTEPPIVGIPNSLAEEYLKLYKTDMEYYKKNFPNGFYPNGNTIPILIPKFISQIGSNFFKNNHLPNLNILKFTEFAKVELVLGHSHIVKKYGNQSKQKYIAKIVGYTNIGLTSGIAVPQELLESEKKKALPPEQSYGYESIIIYAKSPKDLQKLSDKIAPILTKNNLSLEENSLFKKVSTFVDQGIKSFQELVHFFSGLILLITGIAIFYAFLYLFIRRENEMGLYRFFGASQIEVISILVLEAGLIALICSLIGYFISYILIDLSLPYFSQLQQILPGSIASLISHIDLSTIFPFKTIDNLKFVLVSILFCMASAFFPALVGSFRPLKRH